MTEFEAATVAYQTASLAIQQARMWSTYAQAGGALLVGGAQCLLISLGVRMMSRATMRALEALIERTAPK